jgi:hypothetical protein
MSGSSGSGTSVGGRYAGPFEHESGHLTDVAIQRCSCAVPPKRVCDLCGSAAFLACSRICLERHLEQVHGVTADSQTRATAYVSRLNRNLDHAERYAGHRRHLSALLTSVGPAPNIGIFGAGNCCDLDPERLTALYQEIHLIDLDAEALERGRESFPRPVRDRVVLHAGIEMSGFVDKLDTWGEAFPDDAEIGRSALIAVQAILQRVGQTFHVVLSDCVLSQLPLSYRRAWIAPRANWERLFSSITAVHLATVVGSVRPGGSGVIACDALGSKAVPELCDIVDASSDTLQSFVFDRVTAKAIRLDPDPATLLRGLQSGRLGAVVESAQVTAPWLWDTGDILLVFGLVFRLRSASAWGSSVTATSNTT